MTANIQTVTEILTALGRKMSENKELLIDLDSRMGDGDLGLTMSRGFTAAAEMTPAEGETDIGRFLAKVGMEMSRVAPSTMGTLMATGFMRGGKALKGQDTLSVETLRLFFKAFVEGMMERGKSKRGEKTIIDVLGPAADALEQEHADVPSAMQAALAAAREGLEATKQMVACHGRAAYYQEKSLGHQDSGATAGLLLMEGFAEVLG